MFKKVLFATTASPSCDAAAQIAFELTRKFDSHLTIFHVFGFPSHGYSPFVIDIRTGEEVVVEPDYVEWVEEEMKNTYEKQISGQKNISISTKPGQPYTEILKIARKEEVDLIIMGSHTREYDIGSTRFRFFAGSNMQKVVKSARCPVLVVSRPCQTSYKLFSDIVVGVDFSKASFKAFLFAVKMAKAIGSKIHLFHAVSIPQEAHAELIQEEIESRIRSAHKQFEANYLSKLADYKNFEVGVREGVPHVEILKYAREKESNLIIMAHHGRETETEDTVLGSTTEQVILRSACPVISINRLVAPPAGGRVKK